jgi:RHS repeat-associated protein
VIGSITTNYSYDGDGRRVQKMTGSSTTTYVYDAAGQLAAEYGGAAPTFGGTIYLTADHLGSTRAISNCGTGTSCAPTLLERYDYAPFGEEITQGIDGRGAPYSNNSYPSVTPDGATEKFTSKERDAETGLDYFGARYFSSAQGRFTSPDWSARPQPVPYADLTNPQTLNLYAYVRNNPLSMADADGHCDTWCLKLATWVGVGVATQGGKQFTQNVAAGAAKGVGSTIYNAVMSSNPLLMMVSHYVGQPSALKPSNETQAQAKTGTEVAVAVASVAAGGIASSGAAAAEVSETAASTSLFRAVGSAEAKSIETTGAFTNPYGTELKGFFFNQSDAESFGAGMTQMTGDTHTVVAGEAPTSLVNSGIPHNAATEGPGVYFKSEQLPQVKVKLPDQP